MIGRSRECDITVDDANISRRHAEIRREDGAYWIVDLGSTNGIEVNGRRVDRSKLVNNDRIVFGRTDALFESPSERGPGGAGPPRTQSGVPRPPLPVHLARRPDRRARSEDPAGELRLRTGAGPLPTSGTSAGPRTG